MSIELAALDAAETAKLTAEIKGRNLDLADSLHLFHETEGNPLFVVETVRATLGGALGEAIIAPPGPAASQSHTLPPRVYALIAGRLAQLSPSARKVAELGAAIGRTFSLDLLRRAGNEDEVSVIDALDELGQKQIVCELSANQFDFTHDKLREVAYAQIGRPQCRQLHLRIAEALEALNAQNLDTVSTQIAAHYEQAGLFAQALPYYQRAASAVADVYANDSAIDLFTRALALLAEFPVGAARDTQELVIQLALSPLYRITKGWASPEVERGLNHALELNHRVGDVAQRAQTLYGLQ